ncbi:MAG: 2-hydroxyacyl-CoA dehydratase family protein [Dehalococcoidales bacterium]|nr:2-hydroxyacyl-CoA dehydratase family protein [Dehalococcoidales bacterium]
MYSEFLRLCGFDQEEIEKEQTRIAKAFRIWEITAEDVRRAEERIKGYFDPELTGMYKLRRLWIKEFVDMTLAKAEGKKVIYSSFPSISQITVAMANMSDKVFSTVPEPIIMTVMGQYFGKLGPILEQAEKSWLPPGQAHCAFLQARLACILGGKVALPDLLISVGIACDQAGKTDEIIEYLKGIPVVHVDSCNDESGYQWPYPDPRRVRYLGQELKNVADVFQQVIGLELTEETINQGVAEWSRLKTIIDKIKSLREKSDPLPMSEKDWQNVFELGSLCSGRSAREGLDAVNTLLKEVQARVDQGKGILPKGAPRVINFFGSCSDPAVTEVIEKAGLASITGSGSPSARREKSSSSMYKSIWDQIAAKNLNSAMHASATIKIDEFKNQCEGGSVDGLIIAALVKCRAQAIHPRKAKEIIERELGIRVLAIEFDNLDSREYSAEYFRSRVEPFAEMLKNKKKMTLRG